MNTSLIARAITARLLADNGAGGLFETTNGPLWDATAAGTNRLRRYVGTDLDQHVGPNRKPVVVFTIAEVFRGEKDQTFTGDGATATIRFDIYSAPQTTATDITSEFVQQVQARIYGDASLSTDPIPSYGLHRHALTLSGEYGWAATQVLWVRSSETYDEKFHVVGMEFTTRMVRGG